MKKFGAALCGVVLVLAGCGTDSPSEGPGSSEPNTEATQVKALPAPDGEARASCRMAMGVVTINPAKQEHREAVALNQCDSVAEWMNALGELPSLMGVESAEDFTLDRLAGMCEGRDSLSVCADAIESGLFDATGEGRVPTQLAFAAHSCSLEDHLQDDGASLTLDAGASGSLGSVSCILNVTEAPQEILDQIESTQAADGQQEGQWGDGLKARWTTDADSGVQITFTEEN